jgi:hypothetical protein
MIVQVYDQIPESGTVKERWFDAVGDCTWVRFVTDDPTEWAGVFGNGDMAKHRKAVLFGDERTAMVIAGGQGYIVDAQTGELHHKTDYDCFCDAVTVPGRQFVIACDFTNLYAVAKGGVVWRSSRIALDGIKLDSATETFLAGQGWEIDGWHPFTLSIDDWHVQGDIRR